MTRKTATVSDGVLYGEQTHHCNIQLGSSQWFAWLTAPENRSFSYALFNRSAGYIDGFMTVRKEQRQRGAAYWSAYRRHGRRLRKIYLGPSSALTELRLAEVADCLLRCQLSVHPSLLVDESLA